MTEPELLQGGTAHRSRHERDVDGEGSRGGYPPDPDAILRYPGNVLVGPSDNRVRISESESEEGVEVNEPVSARTRVRETKTDSRMAKGKHVAAAVATVPALRSRRLDSRRRDTFIVTL